jgi:hypothetical protein
MLVFATSDPNWFYSTLAQATAALVGLAGAFLVQRLLVQRSEIGPERERIRRDALNIVEAIRKQAEDCEVVLDSLVPALEEARALKPVPGTSAQMAGSPSAFDPGGGVSGEVKPWLPPGGDAVLEDAVASVRGLLDAFFALNWSAVAEDIRVRGRLRPPDPSWLADPGPRPNSAKVELGTGIWPRLEEQRFTCAYLWAVQNRAVEVQAARLAELRSRLVPKSMYFLFGILLALLIAGVVAPLVFLDADGGPSKWILLGVFAVFAVAFVAYFGVELWQLRRADRLERINF